MILIYIWLLTLESQVSYGNVMRRRLDELCEAVDGINIPTLVSVRNVMSYTQRKNQSALPKSLEDVNVADGDFVFQEGSIVMMISQPMIFLLEGKSCFYYQALNPESHLAAECIYADGTFKVAPRPFLQLYTVHVLKEEAMICCAYFCLPSKTEEVYRKMW